VDVVAIMIINFKKENKISMQASVLENRLSEKMHFMVSWVMASAIAKLVSAACKACTKWNF